MARLEFVNRVAELAALRGCLEVVDRGAALVILRAPTGYGKSRLVDQLRSEWTHAGAVFCVVDPSVRAAPGTSRLHEGFFIQRCAEAFNTSAAVKTATWPGLGDFLRHRRWKTISEKAPEEALGELPTPAVLYRVAFDYATRMLGFGRFGVPQLLRSDQAHAVTVCMEYVRDTLRRFSVALVLREAQLIDASSLAVLLDCFAPPSASSLILEYTTEAGGFSAAHQKAIVRVGETHPGLLSILDLDKLPRAHLESLIRSHVAGAYRLEVDAYGRWDGNLRSVVELSYKVGRIGLLPGAPAIAEALDDVGASIAEHLTRLPGAERLVLAILLANEEALDREIIVKVTGMSGLTTPQVVDRALLGLVETHGMIAHEGALYRLHDESVATALRNTVAFAAMVAASEAALRDYYRSLVVSGDYLGTGMAAAVRQLFRLCGRTRDAAGLIEAVGVLDEEVRKAQDQRIYVEAVSAALGSDPDLYGADHDELIVWAAKLAYGVADWGAAQELMRRKGAQDPFSMLLRACTLQEIGEHAAALDLARAVASQAPSGDAHLAAHLVVALVVGCLGDHARARDILDRLIADSRFGDSPLLGYAFRFYEMVDGFVARLPRLQSSIAWFDRYGFVKSKAYSQLAAAVSLARGGHVDAAKALGAEARLALAGEVRDQHLILNDLAAIELLSREPDIASCCYLLAEALRTARDDYSELTILTNLTVAKWVAGQGEAALANAQAAELILREHDFADVDIIWPVCFNLAQVHARSGDGIKAVELMAFPKAQGQLPSLDQDYWAFRFGQVGELVDDYRFLAAKPFHPLYISHWLIDLEGLEVLRRGRLQ